MTSLITSMKSASSWLASTGTTTNCEKSCSPGSPNSRKLVAPGRRITRSSSQRPCAAALRWVATHCWRRSLTSRGAPLPMTSLTDDSSARTVSQEKLSHLRPTRWARSAPRAAPLRGAPAAARPKDRQPRGREQEHREQAGADQRGGLGAVQQLEVEAD